MTVKDPDRKEHQDGTKSDGIDDHLLGIELQILLVPRADTGDTYHQERHDLTPKHVTVLIHVHQLQPVMEVNEDATPEVQDCRVNGILEELHHQGEVDEGAEYLVQRL